MQQTLRLTLLSAICAAFTSASSANGPRGATTCGVSDIPSVDSTWRAVHATGFRFCVPGSWKAKGSSSDSVDAKRWEGDGGLWVTWDLGRPRTIAAGGGETRQSATAGVVRTAPGSNPAMNPAPPNKWDEHCPEPTADTFMADSVVVVVNQSKCRGIWMTTAWSTAPAVYIQGQARSEEAARTLNAVVVTIHFTRGG